MKHRKFLVVLIISICVCSLFGAELNFEGVDISDYLNFKYSSDYLDVDVHAMSRNGWVELSDTNGLMKLCISPQSLRGWICSKYDHQSLFTLDSNVHVLIESLDHGIEFDGIWEESEIGEYIDIPDELVPHLLMMFASSDLIYVELTGDKMAWNGPYREFLYIDEPFVKHVFKDVYHEGLVVTDEDLFEANSLNIELENYHHDTIYENGRWGILGKNENVCAYLVASSKEGYDFFVIDGHKDGYLRFNKHPGGEDIILQDGYISKSNLADIVQSMGSYYEAEIVYIDGTQEIRIPVEIPNISEVDGFVYQLYQMQGNDMGKLH